MCVAQARETSTSVDVCENYRREFLSLWCFIVVRLTYL